MRDTRWLRARPGCDTLVYPMRSTLDFVRDGGWQPPVSDEGTDEWEVIVVGAGPAGSIAAGHLARSGYRVLLLDGQKFPRDKTCGDALIPDSLKVLERTSLLPEILKHGNQFSLASVFSPSDRKSTRLNSSHQKISY